MSSTRNVSLAEGLFALTRTISSCPDSRSAAKECIRTVVALPGVKGAAVLLNRGTSGKLELYESLNLPPDSTGNSESRVQWESLIEDEAARKRAPVLVPDIGDDDRTRFYGPGTLSVCAVPVMGISEVVGVLSVSTADPHRLDRDGAEILCALGCFLGLFFESHNLNRSLQDKKREMEEMNRDLDELLAAVSHDLRSPLATIGGYASLLAKKSVKISSEDEAEFTRIIFRKAREASQRLSDAVTYFRTSSPVSRDHSQIVNVRQVLHSSLEEAASRDRRKGTTLVIPDYLPNLWGSSDQLGRIFENLLSNAFKFTSSIPEPRIVIGYEKTGGGEETVHTFRVSDNGPGIPEDYRESIFRLFSTGPPEYDTPGSGVGLAVVKRIVTLNGGTLSVGSTGESSGATFTFTLPWTEAEGCVDSVPER